MAAYPAYMSSDCQYGMSVSLQSQPPPLTIAPEMGVQMTVSDNHANNGDIELIRAELEQLEIDLQEEQANSEFLSEELEKANRELQKALADLDRVDEELHSTTCRLEDSQGIVKTLEILRDENELKFLRVEEQFENKEVALTSARDELKETQKQRDYAISKIAELGTQQRIDSSRLSELELLKQEMASKIEELEQCHSTIKELMEQQASYECQLEEQRQQVAILKDEIAELERELVDLDVSHGEVLSKQKRELDDKLHNLKEQKEELESKVHSLESQLIQVKNDSSIISTESKSRIHALEEEIKGKTERLEVNEEMTAKIQRLNATIEARDRAISKKDEKIAARERQLRESEDTALHLTDQFDDYSSLVDTLSKENKKLQVDNKRLQIEKENLGDSCRRLTGEKNDQSFEMASRIRKLEQLNKDLENKITELEKVRAAKRTEGIVICIDISSSLPTSSVTLAKEAFRTVISGIQSRNPKAHIGIILQARFIETIRKISLVDSATENIMASRTGCGSENFNRALELIHAELEAFRKKFPKRKRRVVLIGDGQGAGFHGQSGIVSKLRIEGVPIHNIVITGLLSTCTAATSSTAALSKDTGGQDFDYRGSSSNLDSEALLGKRKK